MRQVYDPELIDATARVLLEACMNCNIRAAKYMYPTVRRKQEGIHHALIASVDAFSKVTTYPESISRRLAWKLEQNSCFLDLEKVRFDFHSLGGHIFKRRERRLF